MGKTFIQSILPTFICCCSCCNNEGACLSPSNWLHWIYFILFLLHMCFTRRHCLDHRWSAFDGVVCHIAFRMFCDRQLWT
eukprot:UN22532